MLGLVPLFARRLFEERQLRVHTPRLDPDVPVFFARRELDREDNNLRSGRGSLFGSLAWLLNRALAVRDDAKRAPRTACTLQSRASRWRLRH